MRPRTALSLALSFGGTGCATQSPLPESAYVRAPLAAPRLPAPPAPQPLPAAPALAPGPDAPLQLAEVLRSVEVAFPLLYAVEQERLIAAGQRLAAEGQFDPTLRAGATDQAGTFSSTRLDAGVQQATPFGGVTTFAGWRQGLGNFPIYYGERKTAEGGEFRAGVSVPLLQGRDIDPRRARLRAAQIAERAADPTIRRARLDAFRAAAQAYWAWQAAGAQYRIAQDLLALAQKRQALLDESLKAKLIGEAVPTLNRRLAAGREGTLLAAERTLQQAALRLSLYLRDSAGDPVVPKPEWLLRDYPDLAPAPPDPQQLAADVAAALARRPELVQFQFEKERRAVELQLAANQLQPALNVYAQAAQDVGLAKKTFTGAGPFDTDRTAVEVGGTFEVPLPLRSARGQSAAARAQLAQLLARERYARDDVTAQVQDAVSELQQAYLRVGKARDELRQAQRVLELDTESFKARQTSLVDLNLQEIAAAEAQVKVVTLLGSYYQAVANYLAALGLDATAPQGGAVLPNPAPATPAPGP
ncbi:MAG TPA: TolC family protein [Gemmata sp.]